MSLGRKMALLGSLAVVLGAIGYLTYGSFTESLVYFYTPAEVLHQAPQLAGRKVRVAGLVKTGTLQRDPARQSLAFVLADTEVELPVRFTGVAPDMFREGQMAVVEGRLDGSLLKANQIMAKHSEDYDPKRVRRMEDRLRLKPVQQW